MGNETAPQGADRAGSMLTFIIVIHLMIVLAMCGLVLLQKSEGGGLGMGSGGGGGFMTSRGTTNVLTRSTAILAACFFATSLLLSVIAGWNRNPGSILQRPGAPVSTPGAPAPKAAPGGNLIEQLGGEPKPSGPQVPQSK
jgi:preprotein translocase subunit SecG